MGKKLDPQQVKLYRATDEVLHYIWDPIGICESPHARNEYRSYLQRVFKMLIDAQRDERIVEYLVGVEAERMGLNPRIEIAKRVVEILDAYKKKYSN